MAETFEQISREMPQEDCRRENLLLFQSCKDKSLQTMLSWCLFPDTCLSQCSFISSAPIFWCGRGTSEVCCAWSYTSQCGGGCAALCSGWLRGCSEGKTTNGEAQCVSVQLLAVRTEGKCEAEAVLPNLLPTPWTLPELREKVPAAMRVLPLMLNPYVVCALCSRSRRCSWSPYGACTWYGSDRPPLHPVSSAAMGLGWHSLLFSPRAASTGFCWKWKHIHVARRK